MLTTLEAGDRLDLSDSRIRQLCRDGELPGATKRGRDWFVPPTAIEHYKAVRKAPGYPAGKPRKKSQLFPTPVFRPELPLAV